MAQRLQTFLSATQRPSRVWPWHFGTGFFDAQKTAGGCDKAAEACSK
jgi:hypothetical protein